MEARDIVLEIVSSHAPEVSPGDLAVVESLLPRLDKAIETHGFRVVSNTVDSESATPRICVIFSYSLPPPTTDPTPLDRTGSTSPTGRATSCTPMQRSG